MTRNLSALVLCLCLIGLLGGALSPPAASTAEEAEKPWFRDATKEYGPIGSGPAAFGDLDGDGSLDLYVTNYEDWKDNTYPYPDLLFRNKGGDKGFEAWWEAKGDQIMPGRGVTFFDSNEDGLPEIYVSNYRLAPN